MLIVHESLFNKSSCFPHSIRVYQHMCKTMQNNAPLPLQERDVSRKLWSIELLHHFKDSLHESQIGQENVPKSWGTHHATTNPASSSALGPPSKPYFGKTNFLSSHVFMHRRQTNGR